jgi:hypothetical protein
MKTKLSHSENAWTILASACLVMFVCLGLVTKAQLPSTAENMITAKGTYEPPVMGLNEITTKVYGKTVYIDFMMKGESENSTLLFEKSLNGKDFKVIDKRECYATTAGSADLHFSFQDPCPVVGISSYRILQLRENGFFYSKTAKVVIEPEVPLVAADE